MHIKHKLILADPQHPILAQPGPFFLRVQRNGDLVLTDDCLKAEVIDALKIAHLLRDSMRPSPYTITVHRDNIEFTVSITIPLSFLYDICRENWLVPPIIQHFFLKNINQTAPIPSNVHDDDIPLAEPLLMNIITDKIMYPYQKSNVAWMNNLESEGNVVEYILRSNLNELNVKKEIFYFDSQRNVLYTKESIQSSDFAEKLTFKGGLLCDEVGLGKTLSMIRLIETACLPRPTLVLCPRRLTNQWISEIKKYKMGALTQLEMSTMVHINKYTAADIEQTNVIVASLSLLENKTYLERSRIFNTIKWGRIIIDEGHEILRYRETKLLRDIYSMTTQHKWICTGTPLAYGMESLAASLAFLSDLPNTASLRLLANTTEGQLQEIYQQLFRRNTRESIKSQIYIPAIEYHLDELEFNPTERAMYDAIPPDDVHHQLQMCSNITVSDKDKSIMGGGMILSIDQVNKAMGTHYKTLCEQDEALLAELVEKIPRLNDEKEEELARLVAEIRATSDPERVKELKLEKQKKTASYKSRLKTIADNIEKTKKTLIEHQGLLQKFRSLDLTHIKHSRCPILGLPLDEVELAITTEGCYYSKQGLDLLKIGNRKEIRCPCTGRPIIPSDVLYTRIETSQRDDVAGSWGTKIEFVANRIKGVLADFPTQKIIIFSRWNRMLLLIGRVLENLGLKYVFVRGNVHVITHSINRFKTDPEVKIILLSSEQCSSGCNLTEASHIFLLDTVSENRLLSDAINEQAIGRAARLGQLNTIHVYNFIMKNTVEQQFFQRV
jgi:SNF2 family DNA or RNA helicase